MVARQICPRLYFWALYIFVIALQPTLLIEWPVLQAVCMYGESSNDARVQCRLRQLRQSFWATYNAPVSPIQSQPNMQCLLWYKLIALNKRGNLYCQQRYYRQTGRQTRGGEEGGTKTGNRSGLSECMTSRGSSNSSSSSRRLFR